MIQKDNRKFIFGFHTILACLQQAPRQAIQLYRREGLKNKRIEELVDIATQKQIEIKLVSKKTLDQWTNGGCHQGLLLEIKAFSLRREEDLFHWIAQKQAFALTSETRNHFPFLLLLDNVQDPHNLGACLRSANAAGVDAVIIPKNRAVCLTPIVRKVASGAAEVTPLIQVVNLSNCLRHLKKMGVWICGLDALATQLIYNAELTGPLGLVLGSEGKGLRRLTRKLCDCLLAIPMKGSVNSLNISVAAGICLFEAVRQRQ